MSLASREFYLKMGYSQSNKTGNTQKQLQSLKAQLYGKEAISTVKSSTPRSSTNTFQYTSSGTTNINSDNNPIKIVDTDFLRHDLLKTTILATIAIGVQLLLASRI